MSKRVGVIVPSTNTAVEPELYRHLPADVSVHTARMHFSSETGGQEAMLDEHLPDLHALGCTQAANLRRGEVA